MNSNAIAMSGRIAPGVTTAYVRDLTRRSAAVAGERHAPASRRLPRIARRDHCRDDHGRTRAGAPLARR
jgi:hypothetical protein